MMHGNSNIECNILRSLWQQKSCRKYQQ